LLVREKKSTVGIRRCEGSWKLWNNFVVKGKDQLHKPRTKS